LNSLSGPRRGAVALLAVLALLLLAHAGAWKTSEPFFNNDETRHVMTGVFFRDLLHDQAFAHPRSYAEHYYLQYPALGLLVWPPLFHFVEGLAMLLFGVSFTVSRLLTLGFGLMAAVYCFRIVQSTHGTTRAAWATLFLGMMPLVFFLSTRAMLEIPALALFLAATWHWLRYLEEDKPRDLVSAALAGALCALTRYDAALVAPYLALLALVRGQGRVLARPAVLLGTFAAAALLAPAFLLAWREIGWLHQASVTGGLPSGALPLGSPQRWAYYPSKLPGQAGLVLLLAAVPGLIRSLGADRRSAAAPYLLLAGFTWLVFTPIGELEPRHVIFWLPAWAFFAAEGAAALPGFAGLAAATALVLVQGGLTLSRPESYVRGYAEAARFVLDHSQDSRVCLFDGVLEGDFIYQVRRLDPARRMSVVRGDRVMYEALDQLPGAYHAMVSTDSALVARVAALGPRWIVIENRRDSLDMPMTRRLRAALDSHTECFHRVRTIVMDSNHHDFKGRELWIFENSCRSAQAGAPTQLNVPELRRKVGAPPAGKD
jgi:hypothetical protein